MIIAYVGQHQSVVLPLEEMTIKSIIRLAGELHKLEYIAIMRGTP